MIKLLIALKIGGTNVPEHKIRVGEPVILSRNLLILKFALDDYK